MSINSYKISGLLLAAGLLVAANGSMSIATFLQKADALKAQGILALSSSDIELLKNEIEGASKLYRADIQKARKTGKTPHSCPPPKGQSSINSDQLLNHFRSYPANNRSRISVKTALYDLMKKRYPCKTK
ncbi:hypothetical protein ACR9YC_01405 [Parasphingorhabdus sp. DH2-15]|uniref:hypothetical protein n=1 Tax=Parasphingorhabdus sp. DH2-15 TaxID=3444112 RepID=UPI003F6828A4